MKKLSILFYLYMVLIGLNVSAFEVSDSPDVFLPNALQSNALQPNALKAKKAKDDIVIDGIANEASWQSATWYPLDKLILGTMPTAEDFSGQFKIIWDEQQLYLMVEIIDDVIFDQHANPLHFYWDDDCLEIFIDEDASGGNHQFNYNAFAYHVAIDNQVVDIGEKHADGSDNFVLLNEHVTSSWRRSKHSPNKIIWEVAVRVYDDTFVFQDALALQYTSDSIKTESGRSNSTQSQSAKMQKPVILSLGKVLGFMLAYCDNDGSKEREHFIGSTDIKAVNGNKNLGYITADVFQQLILIK